MGEVPETGVEFAAIEMRARTLMFWVEVSRELAQDAVGLDAALRNALAQSAAVEVDRACIFGIGAAEQPMGLYHDAEITKLAVTPGNHWEDISLSMMSIENANLTPSAVLMSPRTHDILRRLRDGEGHFMPVPQWCPQILVSKQVSDALGAGADESVVVTGDFSNMVIGVRAEYHLEVLKEAAARKYAIVLLAGIRLDMAIVRPEGFHLLTGLTTSWG
jgi:HK97 family phage major capsid protein